MNTVLYYIKGVAAFLLTVVTNMVVNLQTTGVPYPQNALGWVVLFLTTLLTTAGVVVPRNKQTPKQVETALDKDLTPTQAKAVVKKTMPRGTRS